MKHLAVVVLGALCVNAQAQSSMDVSMYGSIDGGLRKLTNADPAGDSQLTMASNGTYRSNRFGFEGSEDLGGGLKANFVLEAGFVTGTGQLNNANNQLFQRDAHVGISGGFGRVDLGRLDTIAYKSIIEFDPFDYRYPRITYALSSTAGTSDANAVMYTRQAGALTLRAGYAFGEVPGSTASGPKGGVGAVYASRSVRMGAAYTRARQDVGSTAAPDCEDYAHYALGGAYIIGALTVSLGNVHEKQDRLGPDNTSRWEWAGLGYQLKRRVRVTGAWYRITAFNTTATANAAAGDGKKDEFMVGATYDLSKRTNLYGEVDFNKLAGAFAKGGNRALEQTHQTGMSAGIMHMF